MHYDNIWKSIWNCNGEKQYMFWLNQSRSEVGQRGMQRKFQKQWIQMVHSAAIWYDISTCSTFESNESKWCILTRFETYARRVLGIRECYPIPPSPSLFIANLDVLFFSFFEMKCRPGPTGPIGATLWHHSKPVRYLNVSVSNCCFQCKCVCYLEWISIKDH